MLTIGLTGGIGTGKTTVANLFAEHGIIIIDADKIARELTDPHEATFQTIVNYFGSSILLKDGQLDRRKLRQIIFDDPKQREWLESVLHPPIRERIQDAIKHATSPYCIVVIPLLFETGAYSFIDRVLVVDVAEGIQIARIQKRDHATKDQIRAILNTQTDRKTRYQGASDIILNEGSVEDLKPQIETLHRLYLQLSTTNQ